MLVAAVYLNIQSLSKASVIAVFVLLLGASIISYSEERNVNRLLGSLLIVGALGITAYLFLFTDFALIFSFRLQHTRLTHRITMGLK